MITHIIYSYQITFIPSQNYAERTDGPTKWNQYIPLNFVGEGYRYIELWSQYSSCWSPSIAPSDARGPFY